MMRPEMSVLTSTWRRGTTAPLAVTEEVAADDGFDADLDRFLGVRRGHDADSQDRKEADDEDGDFCT
jgi:hypothetical protein